MSYPEADRPQEQIIRLLSPPHCARGPKRCSKCEEAAKTKKICLLRIFFDAGEISRPMIEIEREGIWSIHEYDVLRYFENRNEAQSYAKEYGITDIDLS